MLKIMGRFIFPDYPEMELVISKTAFDVLVKEYSKISKIYIGTDSNLALYQYWLQYTYNERRYLKTEDPSDFYRFNFSHKNPLLPFNVINHLLLNFALFIKFIYKNNILNNFYNNAVYLNTCTITKCRYSEIHYSQERVQTSLRLIYTLPHPKYKITLITFIHMHNPFLDICSPKLSIPYFIFNPSSMYYCKTLPSLNFHIIEF